MHVSYRYEGCRDDGSGHTSVRVEMVVGAANSARLSRSASRHHHLHHHHRPLLQVSEGINSVNSVVEFVPRNGVYF